MKRLHLILLISIFTIGIFSSCEKEELISFREYSYPPEIRTDTIIKTVIYLDSYNNSKWKINKIWRVGNPTTHGYWHDWGNFSRNEHITIIYKDEDRSYIYNSTLDYYYIGVQQSFGNKHDIEIRFISNDKYTSKGFVKYKKSNTILYDITPINEDVLIFQDSYSKSYLKGERIK